MATVLASALRRVRRGCRGGESGCVGIDVGTRAVKLARVRRDRDGWKFDLRLLIPADLSEDGLAAHALRRLLEADLPPRRALAEWTAACVPSMAFSDYRRLDLPEGSAAELRAMVAAELEDDEGEAAERVFDFWRSGVGPAGEAGCREFSVLSLRTDVATAIAEDLLPSGFCCRTLDGLPFALARAVETADPNSGRHPGAFRGAVDLGASAATFVLCRQGQPIFTRALRGCQIADVVQDLGERLGVPPDACGLLLSRFGLADLGRSGGPAGVVRECLSAAAGRLVEELRRTLEFLKQQAADVCPRELLLFGGGATVRGIGPALSRALSLPVRPWELRSAAGGNASDIAPVADAVFGPACAMSMLSVLSARTPEGAA